MHFHSKETIMNDTSAPVRSLDSDRLRLPTSTTDGAHLTLADRIELRVGLWLLLRSTRRLDSARDHHEHARLLANARQLAAREHAAFRRDALGGVRI